MDIMALYGERQAPIGWRSCDTRDYYGQRENEQNPLIRVYYP